MMMIGQQERVVVVGATEAGWMWRQGYLA